MRFEPLEDRRLLSITVNTLVDEADGSIVDGDISLRDAIAAATSGEKIDFSVAGTLQLTSLGQLVVDKSLLIIGPGASFLTIIPYDANPQPFVKTGDGTRGFFVSDGDASTSLEVTIRGLTIRDADVSVAGAAIYNAEDLTIDACEFRSNYAVAQSPGGAIASVGGNLTVTSSHLTNNHAGKGGGIFIESGALLVMDTSISNNTGEKGGGIYSTLGDATIVGSVINGNLSFSDGGGIHILNGNLNLLRSRLSYNTITSFDYSSVPRGGGIYFDGDLITITDSSLVGNESKLEISVPPGQTFVDGAAGAIWAAGVISIINSSVFFNSAANGSNLKVDDGGAIDLTLRTNGNSSIRHTTIASNAGPSPGIRIAGASAGSLEFDHTIVDWPTSNFGSGSSSTMISSQYSLFSRGFGLATTNIGGNLLGTSSSPLFPGLDYSGFYSGSSWTLDLSLSSPAIDAGDLAAVPGEGNVPLNDQRGAPFARIFDGDGVGGARIDIGAVEHQPIPAALFGDYNQNGATDAADYVLWRKTVGASVTPFSGADGDGDGVIGQGDYGVWRNHFGAGGAGLGAGGIASLELEVGSGEGGQSRVEGRGSRAGVLVEASSLNSNDMAVGALAAMPVFATANLRSERLAHVAASLRDADGGVQAGAAAIWEVESSDRARRALAEPVAPHGQIVLRGSEQYVISRSTAGQASSGTPRNAATVDSALVAWLSSCRGERYQNDDASVDCVRGNEPGECSSFEFADAVFAGLKGTLP